MALVITQAEHGAILCLRICLEKRMPDNRLYQGLPLNSYEMEDKLGTAKKRYFAYPFINFGD